MESHLLLFVYHCSGEGRCLWLSWDTLTHERLYKHLFKLIKMIIKIPIKLSPDESDIFGSTFCYLFRWFGQFQDKVLRFSSSEFKAQVNCFDHILSVFLLSVRLSVCTSVCTLLIFWTSSLKPLGQFKPNLAQTILMVRWI